MKGFESENQHKGAKIDLMSQVEWIPTYKLSAGGIKPLLFFVICFLFLLLDAAIVEFCRLDEYVGIPLIISTVIICMSSMLYYDAKKPKSFACITMKWKRVKAE